MAFLGRRPLTEFDCVPRLVFLQGQLLAELRVRLDGPSWQLADRNFKCLLTLLQIRVINTKPTRRTFKLNFAIYLNAD